MTSRLDRLLALEIVREGCGMAAALEGAMLRALDPDGDDGRCPDCGAPRPDLCDPRCGEEAE